jgi:hypothetical protein
MSRPPALTPAQQADVRRRLAAGEGVRPLAREFGVGVATINRLAEHTERVRKVAEKVAAAQTALAELPPAHQHQALTLAEQLRKVSEDMAAAAVHAAGTARRLHSIASAQANKVNPDDPALSLDELRQVAALTKLANESAAIPLGLMSSNKDRMPSEPPPAPPAASVDPAKLSNEALQELLAARLLT